MNYNFELTFHNIILNKLSKINMIPFKIKFLKHVFQNRLNEFENGFFEIKF